MRRWFLATAALMAAVVAYSLVTRPPRRRATGVTLPPTVVMGAYHVHSTRSDGAATPEHIAAAVARAGGRFVILTDHGDATRVPDAPRYVDGVLLIDSVEISTEEGHVVALGLSAASPYPLGGEARDVIEDIHRQGGVAIVAHPDSARDALKWRPAAPEGGGRRGGGPGGDLAGADGLEWLNADSAWREHGTGRLLEAALRLPFRAGETVATLFDRPEATLRRWDTLARRRPVVGLGALDAHGVAGGGYGPLVDALAQGVQLDRPLIGAPGDDARLVLDAVRRGHTFTVITGFATAAAPVFEVTDGIGRAGMGDHLVATDAPRRLTAAVDGAADAKLSVRRDDRVVASGFGRLALDDVPPGVYRLEATWADGRMPWLLTNPIYVDAPAAPPGPAAAVEAGGADDLALPLPMNSGWQVEHSPSSTASMAARADGADWRYALGLSDGGRDFAAFTRPLGPEAETFDRLEATLSADAPARVQVQFRLRGGHDDERWGRSVYVDPTPRRVTIRLADLQPIGFTATRRPIAAHVEKLLFVLAWPTTAPGTRGTLHVADARLLRRAPSVPDAQQQVQRPGQEQQVGRPGRQGGRQ